MSRFRKVEAATWGDRRFRGLSDEGRLLWLFLLTGPHVTSLPGVITIGRAALAEDIGWSVRKLEKAFVELSVTDADHPFPMAVTDWKSRIVWLPNAPKHNRPTNEFVVRSWRGHWACVPECPLRVRIESHLRGFVEAWGPKFANAFAEFVSTAPSSPPLSEERSNPSVIPLPLTPPSNPPVQSSTAPAPAPAPAPADPRVAGGASRPEDPPPWFVGAIDIVEANTGETLDRPAAWLRYSGHRTASGKPMGAPDAQQWLVSVDLREARERRRRETGRAERYEAVPSAESGTRARWPAEPPPEPEPEYTAEELAAIDARLEAALRPSTEIAVALTADPELAGDPRLPKFKGTGT